MISSTWTGSGVIAAGNLTPANPTNTILLTATNSGTGKLTATDAAGGIIDDISGVITINAGTTTSVLIMDAPGGTGSEIFAPSLTTGNVLNLYANGFDDDGNFSGNINSTWGVTGDFNESDLSTTSGSSTIFVPSLDGSGTITISSGDATGTIVVSTGTLASMEIRTESGGAGVILNDTTKAAGETLTLYAAGYDQYGNFIADQSVTWSIEGSAIGSFGTGTPATTNIFTAETVNSARIKINSGSINDYSGIVNIVNGAPASMVAISLTNFGGQAGGVVTDSLAIRLLDAFGNVVPDSSVTWTTSTDGSLAPAVDVTDALGASRTEWTLRSSAAAGKDTAYANYLGLPSIEFIATVNSSDASSLLLVSGDGESGTVGSTLSAQPLTVRVEDTNNNPVQGISVTFSITSIPSGASSYSLSTQSVLTNSSGVASTVLTLGDKVGTYIVQAFNEELLQSPQTFTSTATVDVVNSLAIFSGNEQSGTVAVALSNNIIVKATDQYGNDVAGATVTWEPTTGGSIVGQAVTDAAGLDDVTWTLRTSSGPDTLLAILAGLDTVTYTATANAGAANSVVVLSGNNKTTVAGSNQIIEARVLDQFGNYVSGKNVSFLPASNMSGLNSTSNGTGLVSAVYRTPSDQDSSTAQVAITGPSST
ncbi:MAG: hypothetical protein GY727_05200, partial [Gammaproteobacteria bacterium]|nr:hypothetical protein [Gammaproteobacteria bacterium]